MNRFLELSTWIVSISIVALAGCGRPATLNLNSSSAASLAQATPTPTAGPSYDLTGLWKTTSGGIIAIKQSGSTVTFTLPFDPTYSGLATLSPDSSQTGYTGTMDYFVRSSECEAIVNITLVVTLNASNQPSSVTVAFTGSNGACGMATNVSTSQTFTMM
jgi:hypothetical protein